MKKYYLSPEITAIEVQLTSVLCASGDPEQGSGLTGGNNSFGAPPRREVF